MNINIHHHGSATTFRMDGPFDLGTHREFNKARHAMQSSGKTNALTLDMFGVHYIDSSALGMLLILNGEAEKNNIDVTLQGCQPDVLQVLKLANFHKIFKIV